MGVIQGSLPGQEYFIVDKIGLPYNIITRQSFSRDLVPSQTLLSQKITVGNIEDNMGGDDQRNRLHELALQAKHGDNGALEALVIDPEVKDMIYGIANRMVGQTDAEDVYQEVCLRIAQKIHAWQELSKITTWIGRITSNCCIDMLYKTGQELKKQQQWAMMQDNENQHPPHQIRYIFEQEKMDIVQKALQEMGGRCQQILMLYFFERLDKQAIMDAVQLKKTAFYQAWNDCYNALTDHIQKIVQR